MKKLIFLASLALAFGASAQLVHTGQAKPLLNGVHSELYNPVLSADGKMLLFSAADYSNLRIYDYSSGATTLICTEARSGYDAQFSADGNEVLYVSQKTNSDGLNMRTLRSYNIANGSNANLTEAARFVGRPEISREGTKVTVDGKQRMIGKNLSTGVRTDNSTLYITANGKETAYQPVGETAGYLWASLSPDASKVMFFAAGKGIVVTDLNGNIIGQPGNFEAPVWFGNDLIVAMNATDDCHQFTSSQIVMMTIDGSVRQELTRPESMTMFPTASFAASKIVYNTIDGRLYELPVEIIK